MFRPASNKRLQRFFCTNYKQKQNLHYYSFYKLYTSPVSFSSRAWQSSEMSAPLTSTPNSGEAASKKKRSIGRRSIVFNSTPINPLVLEGESEDDEEERVARRKRVQVEKNLPNTSNPVEVVSFFKDDYIKEQYALYSHLHTENKINPKNAWSIKIIDMLSHLCKSKDSNNFQVAYTSIDIGAKVYGLRVDNVHSDVMKVARNIARVTNEDSPDVDSSNVLDEDNTTVNANPKKAPRKRRIKTKMIQDNPNAHLGPITKLAPTDFTSRLNMDVGSKSSFMCTFLKEDASGCSYIILDETKEVFEDVDPLVTEDVKVSIRGLSFDPEDLKVKFVLSNFSIGDQGGITKNLATTEAVFDEDGIPLHELDGSIPEVLNNVEIDVDNNLNDDDQDNMGLADTKNTVRFDFRAVDHTMAFGPTDYGFNGMVQQAEDGERHRFINHIWAGPSHWKLKGIQREKEVFSGRSEDKPTKKKYVRKVPKEMDFSKVVELDLSDTVALSTRGRKTSRYDRITCPVRKLSRDVIAERLANLITKPGTTLVKKEENARCEVGPYKYENLNDSNYCHDDEEDDNARFPMEDHAEVPEQLNSLDLVEMPEKVSVANLAFSTKAKHMNMKKLKSAIWDILNNTQCEEKVAFSDTYSQLPDSLPEELSKNLSPHMAFVASLHICNEKSIYLKLDETHKMYFCRS